MEDIKLRLTHAVAGKLTAAPDGPAKDELVEELSDNLYRRFLDMTGAGVPEEEAFTRAMEDLGDVDELLGYLGVESGADVSIRQEGGQARITTKDGQKITINGVDDDHITINTGDSREAQPQDGQNGEASHEEAGTAQGIQDERGDFHYDYSGQTAQSDLDAILANVGEICRVAMDQVKEAAKQAKDAIQRRTTYRSEKGHVEFHFDSDPTPPKPPEPPEPPKGWEFEAELDSDEGRFFAGAGPKQKKDVVYGFGYDKAKGGFFAQWGEWKGGPQEGCGPRFTGEDAHMEHQEDDSYSVAALKDLRGIRVQTATGDISILADQAPDAGVVIDGDVDDLDVTCSADGMLTIREGRTASSSFFSRRGIGSADVELHLPCRLWEYLELSTASGDIDIDGAIEIEHLAVNTASGDLNCRVRSCTRLLLKSASGDLEYEGSCADLRAETMSGDIHLNGQVDRTELKTTSGDILLEGPAGLVRASSMSGDVEVETAILPAALDLSSKSGDCRASIPDAGPFTLRFKTVSGDAALDFPFRYDGPIAVYGDGSGPAYSITSVSGDVTVERY